MDDTIKMKDIIKIGTMKELKQNIDFMIGQVEALTKEIKNKDVKNEKIIVLNNIAMKLMEYLKCYKTCIEYNMEVVGFLTRNLFELNLVTRFVLIDNKNLKGFISELFIDKIDIYKGAMKLSENLANINYAILVNEVEEIQRKAIEKGYELKKLPNKKDMALKVGVLNEYESFYKFFSKYSHATSFTINGDPNETDSLEFRNILIIQAQKYVGSTFSIIKEELGKNDDCEN